MLPKITKDYQLINHYAFSSAIYRLKIKHITIKESTKNFHNSTLCINKVIITTTSEDIEEAYIYRDIPIKNLKRCTKVDGFCRCYTCNKIGHLTKNYKLKDKLCPRCNNSNCSGTCPKAIWKCTNYNGNHSAAYRR